MVRTFAASLLRSVPPPRAVAPACLASRAHAAEVLVETLREPLASYLAEHKMPATFIGLTNGGIPIARELSKRLGHSFDFIVTRKLALPLSHHHFFGGLAGHGGSLFVDDFTKALYNINDKIQKKIVSEQLDIARWKNEVYRMGRIPASKRDQVVVLVDDRLPQGAGHMRAAAEAVRYHFPGRVIAVAPVGASFTVRNLKYHVDDVVVPYQMEDEDDRVLVEAYHPELYAVEDAEVERCVREAIEDGTYATPKYQI